VSKQRKRRLLEGRFYSACNDGEIVPKDKREKKKGRGKGGRGGKTQTKEKLKISLAAEFDHPKRTRGWDEGRKDTSGASITLSLKP